MKRLIRLFIICLTAITWQNSPVYAIKGTGKIGRPTGGITYNAAGEIVENEASTKSDTDSVSSEMIKEVQEKLNELGYDCGTADGIAGDNTINGIKRFQEETGLEPTGMVSSELLDSVNDALLRTSDTPNTESAEVLRDSENGRDEEAAFNDDGNIKAVFDIDSCSKLKEILEFIGSSMEIVEKYSGIPADFSKPYEESQYARHYKWNGTFMGIAGEYSIAFDNDGDDGMLTVSFRYPEDMKDTDPDEIINELNGFLEKHYSKNSINEGSSNKCIWELDEYKADLCYYFPGESDLYSGVQFILFSKDNSVEKTNNIPTLTPKPTSTPKPTPTSNPASPSISHVCIECGKQASHSIERFSGEPEWYCDEHWNEMMDILGAMEQDVRVGSYSTHQCQATGCTKEGTYQIIGFSGSAEYYCTEHYLEMIDILNMMYDDVG